MSEDNSGNWVECIVDSDYEIYDQYPYPICRKDSDRIVSESVNTRGYVQCSINRVTRIKHRIIALQFIPNDDPDNRIEVDHINHDRLDNRIENLRWVTKSENDLNRTSVHGVEYQFVDEISDEAIELTDYGKYRFEFYYYVPEEDNFYFFNGVNYRKLHINIHKDNGRAFIIAKDTNNKQVQIALNKFKKLYGLI